jgi:hypothetical protein
MDKMVQGGPGKPLFVILEGLALMMGDQRIDDVVNLSLQDGVQFIKSKSDTVIRNPTLGKIVGSNAFATVTATHLTLTLLGALVILFFDHLVQQSGAQDLKGLGLIFML